MQANNTSCTKQTLTIHIIMINSMIAIVRISFAFILAAQCRCLKSRVQLCKIIKPHPPLFHWCTNYLLETLKVIIVFQSKKSLAAFIINRTPTQVYMEVFTVC